MSHSESQDGKVTRRRARLGSKLERNLWAYAAAAGAAGVGMLAMAPGAEAKVVYTATNQQISPTIALDLNGDGVVDFNLTKFNSASIGGSLRVSWLAVCHIEYVGFSHQCVSSSSVKAPNADNLVRVVPTGAADLSAGAKIGPGPQWGGKGLAVLMGDRVWYSGTFNPAQHWDGPWVNQGKGVSSRYLGFKFKIGSEFHYGWARVTLTTTPDSGFSAALTGYAYETIPGKAIIAGATTGAQEVGAVSPIPTTDASTPLLGMFALGAQGLALWRKDESQGGL
jgi:hypothetical protein